MSDDNSKVSLTHSYPKATAKTNDYTQQAKA